MAQPTLRHIPLDQLRISKLNMRHGRKKPDISDILPSIRESGIRQTLLLRPEGKHFGVIAGRRRFFALQALARKTGETPLVPCTIMTGTDAASAVEASLIENVARLPATGMEQYTAFKRLHDEGRSAPDIAACFGITEHLVRHVLALASLAAPIRKSYAEEELDCDTIRALKLAAGGTMVETVAHVTDTTWHLSGNQGLPSSIWFGTSGRSIRWWPILPHPPPLKRA